MKRLEGKVAVVTGGNSGIAWRAPNGCTTKARRSNFRARHNDSRSAAESLAPAHSRCRPTYRNCDIDKLFAAVQQKFGKSMCSL